MFLRNTLCLLMFALAAPVYAQDVFDDEEEETEAVKRPARKEVKEKYELHEVNGVVFDLATKAPLAGVQVRALGNTRYAAMTTEDGKFTIKVPAFVTSLFVHAPEYADQQVAVSEEIAIYMLRDKFRPMYDEATHYTAARSVKIERDNNPIIDTEIGERLSGDLYSIQRSAAPSMGNAMFIRGLNSLNANSMPLVVIDGVEQDMQYFRNSLHLGQFNNVLANFMPSDIEKVTVLKNATALYGSRGGNGVILIETKRGHSMATRIDANVSVGMNLIPSLPKVMDANQYRNYATEMLGTMAEWRNRVPEFNFMNDDPTRPTIFRKYHNADGSLYNTDWTDETYHNSLTQNYNINVQGGDNVGMYNLSVGYVSHESTAKENNFNRMNVRFNTDIYILPILSTKFDVSIARTNNSVFDDGALENLSSATTTSPTFLSLIKSPLATPYQYNAIRKDFTDLLSPADQLFYNSRETNELIKGTSLANPVAILKNAEGTNKNQAENTYFQAAVAPKLELGRYFTVTEHFSYLLNRNSQRYTRPNEGVPSFPIEGLGTVTSRFGSLSTSENNIMSNTHVDFNGIFGAHTVSAYAGFRYNYFSFDADQMITDYKGETNDKNPHISADTNEGYFYVDGVNDKWKQLQWYLNADYNYKNRYFLTVSLLAEANSRFGDKADGAVKAFGVSWGIFPGVQAGWVLTNEKWFPKSRGINYLRINAGYDISGNDDISNYAARTSYNLVRYSQNLSGFQLTNIGNDKIKWETTRKFNVGLQTYAFDNRIGFGFDYFIHKTSDLLTMKSFPSPIGGINRYWTNGGKLQNEGFEVSFSAKPVVTKDWNVEVGATIGHYKNKVTELPDGDYLSSVYGKDNILTAVGGPIAQFYGYRTQGVFASDDEAKTAGKDGNYLYMVDASNNENYFKAGDVHFVDINGDGKIDTSDKTVIGDPNPDFYGHLFLKANWKNLTLSANFNYSIGGDVYNYQRMLLNSGSNFWNQQVAITNHWRYEGQQTDMPRLAYGDPMENNRFSDRWIEDGSYLRLKTLRLTYQFPVNLSWLQGLSVWAEAVNLFTLSKYLGSDPEFSVSNSVLYQGIDAGNLAQGRAFTLGMKVNL